MEHRTGRVDGIIGKRLLPILRRIRAFLRAGDVVDSRDIARLEDIPDVLDALRAGSREDAGIETQKALDEIEPGPPS